MAETRIIPRDLHLFTAAQLQPLVNRLPAYWPAVWSDLATVFFIGMLNSPKLCAAPEVMAEVALEQTRVVARQIGGRQYYMPAGHAVYCVERDEALRSEFNGCNVHQLADRYGLTTARIRQIVGLDVVKRKKPM